MEIRIKNFLIKVKPFTEYRTTKRGKKIITGKIGYDLVLYITTDKCEGLRIGDIVTINGILCKHIGGEADSSFVNVCKLETNTLCIDTKDCVKIVHLASCVGEGKDKS